MICIKLKHSLSPTAASSNRRLQMINY